MVFVKLNWSDKYGRIAADLVHAYYSDVAREFKKRTGYRLAPDTIFRHSGVE